jgi:signal transduction histidine kinase
MTLSSQNPFHYQGPLNSLDHRSVMIKRTDLIEKMIRGVYSGQWFAITGPRKVGKTTLLLQFYHELKNKKQENRIKFIRVQHLDKASFSHFYSSLLQIIHSPNQSSSFPLPAKFGSDHEFLECLRNVLKGFDNNEKPILVFDGMEYLPPAFLHRFFRILASIYAERDIDRELNSFCTILSGALDLQAPDTTSHNPLIDHLSMIRVKDLQNDDIERWLNRICGQMDFPMESGVIRLLCESTSGMLYLIQKICFHAFHHSAHPFELTCQKIQTTIDNMIKGEEISLQESMRIVERDIELSQRLAQIMDHHTVQKPPDDVHWNRLYFLGLLEQSNQKWKMRNSIYAAILQNNFSFEKRAEIFYRFKEYELSKTCYEQALQKRKMIDSLVGRLGDRTALITQQTDPQSVYRAIIDAIQQIFSPIVACHILVLDKEKQVLRMAAFEGLSPKATLGYIQKVGDGLSGWVAKIGASRFLTAMHWDSFAKEIAILNPDRANEVSALSSLPLKVMGQVIGVLNIYWPDLSTLSAIQQSILTIFASHAAVTIQNVLHYEHVQKTYVDLEAIINLSRKVTNLTGLDFIFDQIVNTVSDISTSQYIFLTYRPVGKQMWAFRFPDDYNTDLVLTDPESENSCAGLTMQRKQMTTINHLVSKDDLIPSWQGVNVELGIPLVAMGQVLGALNIGLPGNLDLSSQQKSWILILAEQAAMALHNMYLYELAEEKTRQVITLKEIGEALGRDMSLQEILDMISKAALNVVGQGNKASFVLLKDENKHMLEIRAASGEAFAKDFLGFKIRLNEKSLVTWVARKGKYRYIPDVEGKEDYLELYPKIRSELAVPLMFRTDLIGVIDIESTRVNAFSDQDIGLLQVLADSAAVAAKVGELCDVRLKHLQALNTAGLEISSTLELDQVLETIIREALNAIDPYQRFVYLQLIDESGQFLKLQVIKGLDNPDQFIGTTIDVNKGMSGWVVREKRHYLCNNVNEDPNYFSMHRNVASAVCVPILFHDKFIGVLNAESFKENDFGTRELEILKGLASQAGAAIENARLSASLIESQFNLTQALEVSVIGETLAGISHDIRTSSSLISGEIHWLLRKKRKSELDMTLVMDSLTKMQKYVDRIERMTNDLARRSQQTPPNLELTRVADLIKESIYFVTSQARRRKIELKIDYETLQYSLKWDRNRMKRVFLNLIMNAFDSMPQGGELIIEGAMDDSQHVITVQDSGAGIDPQFIDKVWKPFTSTKSTGSGLGLAICKRIVEHDHSGKITLMSELGVGTRIVMKFKGE